MWLYIHCESSSYSISNGKKEAGSKEGENAHQTDLDTEILEGYKGSEMFPLRRGGSDFEPKWEC